MSVTASSPPNPTATTATTQTTICAHWQAPSSHLAGPVQQHVNHGVTAKPARQPPPTAIDAPLGDPAGKSHGEGRCKVWRGGEGAQQPW